MQVSGCVLESRLFIDDSRSQVPVLLTVELIRRALTTSLIVILTRLLNYESRSLRMLVELQSRTNAS